MRSPGSTGRTSEKTASCSTSPRRLSALRAKHPVFHRRRYFQGRTFRGSGGLDDIVWLNPAGEVMSQEDWDNGWARSLGVFLNGDAIPDPDSRVIRVTDDSFLLLFNAHFEPVEFKLPRGRIRGGVGNRRSNTAAPLVVLSRTRPCSKPQMCLRSSRGRSSSFVGSTRWRVTDSGRSKRGRASPPSGF